MSDVVSYRLTNTISDFTIQIHIILSNQIQYMIFLNMIIQLFIFRIILLNEAQNEVLFQI